MLGLSFLLILDLSVVPVLPLLERFWCSVGVNGHNILMDKINGIYFFCHYLWLKARIWYACHCQSHDVTISSNYVFFIVKKKKKNDENHAVGGTRTRGSFRIHSVRVPRLIERRTIESPAPYWEAHHIWIGHEVLLESKIEKKVKTSRWTIMRKEKDEQNDGSFCHSRSWLRPCFLSTSVL